MASNSSTSRTPPSLRALLEVVSLPSSLYGQGQAKITRRLVHVMLAKHANPDGTSIHPSKQTLLEECAGLTEYTLGETIKWLGEQKLVRRLPELHPRFGTIQYELLWPDPDEVAKGKEEATDRRTSKQEATRKRTAKWRSRKKQAGTVTQTVSVTFPDGDANLQRSVTLDGDAVTLGCDAVTLDGDACDAENPAFSPSTVLLDRPQDRPTSPVQDEPVDDDGYALSSESNSLGQDSTPRDEFLAKQSSLVLGCAGNNRATRSHIDRSWSVAQSIGPDTYLAILETWGRQHQEELVVSIDSHPVTGRVVRTERSWPLQTFLDSPTLSFYKEKANRLKSMFNVSGDTLRFLLARETDEWPTNLQQVSALNKALATHGEFECGWALDNVDDSAEFYSDPETAISIRSVATTIKSSPDSGLT